MAQKTSYQRIDSIQKELPKIPANEKRQKALALHEIATAYMHMSNHVQAASYYAESLTLASELNDELLLALIYRNMGTLSFNESDTKKSTEYNNKALAIYEKRNDKVRKAELLKGMADNMLTNGDVQNAHRYYDEAIAIFKQTGNRLSEAMAYSNLSLVFGTQYPEKIRLAMEAKKIFDSVHTNNQIPAINSGNIGVAYFDIVRYGHMHLAPPGPLIPATKQELLLLAEKYFREAISIAQSNQDVANAAYFSGLMAELQAYNGDYRNAYYNIRKYFETNDSIYSQDNKNQIASLQNKLEMDLKNSEIETRKLQVKNQQTQLLLLTGGLVFLMILGLLLYRQNQLRKKNNKALQDLNKELIAANQLKAKFFAILSHDIRSPIAKLVSFLQLQKLRPGMLTEDQVREHEHSMETNAQSLLATMEGMLLWSKEQMERFRPVKTFVSIQSVFNYIEANFGDNKNISLQFSVNKNLHLQTDENYLKTILYNLTSNACKALQGTSSATINWRAWEENDAVWFSITDNGPGIPAEQAAIFLEGIQTTDSRHGLGLYIIRDLAKAIDCKLSLGKPVKGMEVLLHFDVSGAEG